MPIFWMKNELIGIGKAEWGRRKKKKTNRVILILQANNLIAVVSWTLLRIHQQQILGESEEIKEGEVF